MHNIILYCRAGFEPECSLEISTCSRQFSPGQVSSAIPGSGFVVYRFSNEASAAECIKSLPFLSLVFSRQTMAASDCIGPLSPGNRVAPVIDAIRPWKEKFSEFFIETADTNDAKQRNVLCRRLSGPFNDALKKNGLLQKTADANEKRLHIFFTATDRAYAGLSYVKNSAPWRMGIPRLKFPAGAPSRSTLKLEEALHLFLSEKDWTTLLKPGSHAVDLGASPGGWSWQFASRGMRVTAVDNGGMDGQLLRSGRVRHIRGDGFTFSPQCPVEWMVCDIVEQPSRIARLAAQWLGRGWCNRSIFNLKLPMKKRYEEVKRCGEIIAGELKNRGIRYVLFIKQLYHDREEVTGYLSRI
jgi:23S rRNA (cytidine2498-2'-O)-methyltransferase